METNRTPAQEPQMGRFVNWLMKPKATGGTLMTTVIEILVLAVGAVVLIAAGAQMERDRNGRHWVWLLGYLAGGAGTTAGMYLLISENPLRIGVTCAGPVLALRAIHKFAQAQRVAR